MTINTDSKEPKTDATVRTDAVWPQESITSPKMSTAKVTEGKSLSLTGLGIGLRVRVNILSP